MSTKTFLLEQVEAAQTTSLHIAVVNNHLLATNAVVKNNHGGMKKIDHHIPFHLGYPVL